MATIAKSGVPSLASVLPPQNNSIPGLLAGEAIAAGDACYIATDGTIMRSNGTSANAAAKFRGVALVGASAGQPVTLWHNVKLRYGAGLTPGTDVYVAATAGAIADTASTGGTTPIGYVVDVTKIHFY